MMKKPLLIGAAFAALIAPAIAAETPVRVYKRSVVAAAPVSSWSGFYIGGALGENGRTILGRRLRFQIFRRSGLSTHHRHGILAYLASGLAGMPATIGSLPPG
jgi:hypothetical protein